MILRVEASLAVFRASLGNEINVRSFNDVYSFFFWETSVPNYFLLSDFVKLDSVVLMHNYKNRLGRPVCNINQSKFFALLVNLTIPGFF